MRSFFVRRSQKRKNGSQVIGHFLLWGFTCVKAARKHVDEIGPSRNESQRSIDNSMAKLIVQPLIVL